MDIKGEEQGGSLIVKGRLEGGSLNVRAKGRYHLWRLKIGIIKVVVKEVLEKTGKVVVCMCEDCDCGTCESCGL